MKTPHPYDWMTANLVTLDAVGGLKPFPDWPYLRELVDAVLGSRILLVAKSRQMMVTWTVAALALHQAFHEPPGLMLFLSKTQRDSQEILKRLAVMTRHLPDSAGAEVRFTEVEARFPSGSRIISLPATEYSPRSYSPSFAFWDEMAFTPHAEDIWASVKPAVDSGGRFVGVSTPNGTDNLFHRLFTSSETEITKHLVHYSRRPDRDAAWRARAQAGLSAMRWRQEYEIDFDALADRVYDEFDPAVHILAAPDRPDLKTGRVYRGLDFGFRHPYVLWLHHAPDGALTVFAEWEGADATIETVADAIAETDRKWGLTEDDVACTFCDPAGASVTDFGISPAERLMRRGLKLHWRTSEIMTGVDLVKSRLRDAAGQVSLRFTADVPRTLFHLRHYRWDENRLMPIKDGEHDHAMDALRYAVVSLAQPPATAWSEARVAGAKW